VRIPGGIRVRIALALVAIVGLALAAAYLIVVPSLEQRLVDARLEQLEGQAVPLSDDLPSDRFLWPDAVDGFAVATNSRVVAFDVLSSSPPALAVSADSYRTGSRDVVRDPVALRALESGKVERGRVVESAGEVADVAIPLDSAVLLFQAPLADSLATVPSLSTPPCCCSRRLSRTRSRPSALSSGVCCLQPRSPLPLR